MISRQLEVESVVDGNTVTATVNVSNDKDISYIQGRIHKRNEAEQDETLAEFSYDGRTMTITAYSQAYTSRSACDAAFSVQEEIVRDLSDLIAVTL